MDSIGWEMKRHFVQGGPFVITGSATNITQFSATLNGELTLLKSSNSCEVWFEYCIGGFFINPHKTKKITLTSPCSFNIYVMNLLPIGYQYRAVASNDIYTHYGEIETFPPSGSKDNT